jgi:hypothetical protein
MLILNRFFALVILACFVPSINAGDGQATEHRVHPGEDPQLVLDRAAPGDRIMLLPGLHERPLGRHQSILYVDKPIDIELADGAILKLADDQTVLSPDPEITTDHSRKTIDDLEMGGTYDLTRGAMLLTITIDGEGPEQSPDSFSWAYGVFGKAAQTGIKMTGEWQPLANGIDVRFGQTTGHNKGAFWFVSYDGAASYGIRVGHGTQKDDIENVRVSGRGTIDLNRDNNIQPSPMVKDISACVLVHGRVRNVDIEGITMVNTMRSVMLYGEHTGKFLAGGGVQGGESFDAENISILSTRTINPGGAAYLLGHPSHRGHLRNVRCNFNTMLSSTTSLEPNLNLDGYEVIGNLIQSGGEAVHCWRRSTNGRVEDNVRLGNPAGRRVVTNNAPGGWKVSENLLFSGNINLQKGPFPDSFTATADPTTGHIALRTVTNDDGFHPLVAVDQRPLSVAAGTQSTYRFVVLVRDEDASEYAAFSGNGLIKNSPDGLKLLSNRVVPASRSGDAILLRVHPDADDNSLHVEVRGLAGRTMTWVGRLELVAAGS